MDIYIEKVNITSFGGVSDREYRFEKGLNVVEGANESGKSTLAAFIKFIFYGASGKNVGGISEKVRWTSWERGILAGTLTLSADGRRYRIERSLVPGPRASGKETLRVINLDEMKEEKLSCEVGEHFFKISGEVFSQTAFALQKRTDSVDGKTVREAIENMLFSGSEAMSTKAAITRLDEKRVALLHKNGKGGKIYELSCSRDKLYERLAASKKLSSELSERKKRIESIKEKIKENNEKIALLEKYLYTARATEVLEGFDEYDKVLAEYENKNSERERAIKEASAGGFLPDEEYITELHGMSAGYTFLLRQMNDRSEELMEKKAEYDRLCTGASKGIMDVVEGREIVVSKIESSEQKIKRAKTTFAIFCSFFVMWFAVFFVTLFVSAAGKILHPTITLAITALFAAISVFTGIYLKKTLKEKREIFDRYGIKYASEIHIKLDVFEKELEKRARLSDDIIKIGDDIGALKERIRKNSSDSAALLEKWNRSFTDMSDVERAASDARSAVDRISLLNADISALYSSLCRLRKMLSEKDREKARAIVASRGAKVIGKVSYSEAEDGLKELAADNARLEAECKAAELELASSASRHEDPSEIASEIESMREPIETLEIRFKACVLAMESLQIAGERMRNSIAPRVSAEIESFTRKATGVEKSISVNADMLVSFRADENGLTHSESYLSSGTKDLLYIALRLSLSKLLCKDRVPPIIFDEAFCQIDNERLERTVRLLDNAQGIGQIIVLTSNSREGAALERIRASKS